MICTNPSEWRVSCNRFGGGTWYAVYRRRNVDEVDHSGNREYRGGYFPNKEKAQEFADSLNKEETNE